MNFIEIDDLDCLAELVYCHLLTVDTGAKKC